MSEQQFATFYKRHFERVYRFVFYRVKMNRDVAEDLTSEIFMKALKHFEKYDPDRSQVAWIMTIARNHLANYYRDKKEHVDLDDVSFCLQGEDGREQMARQHEDWQLMQALKTIPEKDAHLIRMKYLEGYRYKEMAEVLDKSTVAVRVETHRAMKKLKQAFPSYDDQATTEETRQESKA